VLRRVVMSDLAGQPTSSLRLGQPFRLNLLFDSTEEFNDFVVEVGIATTEGERIATVQNVDRAGSPLHFSRGGNEVEVDIEISLLPGEYGLDVGVHNPRGQTADYVEAALQFNAVNLPDPEGEEEGWPWSLVRGSVRPRSTWSEAKPASELVLDAPSP
jgi:hypothetical protein